MCVMPPFPYEFRGVLFKVHLSFRKSRHQVRSFRYSKKIQKKKKNYCRPSFFAATIALSFSTKTHCSRIFSLRPSSHKSFS